eukprot:SAG31_NODE_23576_length_501_cov_1.017413_1_plen_154_part_01
MFEGIIRLDPTDAWAYHDLASTQLKLRQLSAAEDTARRAVALSPGSKPALVQLVQALTWQGQQSQQAEANSIRLAAVEQGLWLDSDQYPVEFDPLIKSAPWPTVSVCIANHAIALEAAFNCIQILQPEMFPSLPVAKAISVLETNWKQIAEELQ